MLRAIRISAHTAVRRCLLYCRGSSEFPDRRRVVDVSVTCHPIARRRTAQSLDGVSGNDRVYSETSREAESKVVVAEGRIELAAQRDAADRVRVTPRATARDASHTVVGACGVPLR
jgi:hypothetical protein